MEKHICTCVYIFDPTSKKFLLVNHKKLGKWIQPGGHVDPGEDMEECAIREAKEETGLDVRLVGKRTPRDTDYILPLGIQRDEFKPDSSIHVDFIYLAEPISQKLTINNRETDGLAWFTADEINDVDFDTFDDVRMWARFINDRYAKDND